MEARSSIEISGFNFSNLKKKKKEEILQP